MNGAGNIAPATAADCAWVDVVVAGAGGAGLTAALSAAQAGASVLVVEANGDFRRSCNTALSTSMIPAGGSRWQRAAGAVDSPGRFLGDIMAKTHGTAEHELAVRLTATAPELVSWLSDQCGIELELVTDFDYPGHSVRRCHTVPNRSGAALHAGLLSAVHQSSSVTLDVPCRLVDVTEAPGGAISGVLLKTPRGEPEQVRTRSVILATNGFAADAALVATLLPEMGRALYFGGPGSTGDALRIGRRLGVDTAGLDSYQGHGSVAVPHGVLLTWAVMMHGGIQVNALGRRFADETSGYSEFASLVLTQPGHHAWAIYDQRIHTLCQSFADYQRCCSTGAIRWSADIVQLAEATGAPAAGLAATISALETMRDGTADSFGRRRWPHALTPPYAAVRVTGALFHTQGGLRVDGNARVLRKGLPVEGLYAAGGAAVGISGHGAAGYLAGNGLLAALGLGYLAGRDAGLRATSRSTTL